MKRQNNFLKTLLLAVALLAGSSMAWADVTPVSIPQSLGTYIPLSTDNGSNFENYVTTHEGCGLDNRLSSGSYYYTIGNTSGSTAILAIQVTVSEGNAGDYVFGFKTGSNNGTSTVAITLTKSGDTPINIATAEPVTQDGNWDPNVGHNFYISGLEVATYTITLTATKTSGSYCGNFGLFSFHKVTQYPTLPLTGTIANEETHIDLSGATYNNAQYNNDKVISGLDNGGYMDNIFLYNSTAGYYNLLMNTKDKKTDDGTLTATIYDVATGTAEATGNMNVTADGDKTITLTGAISIGLKRMRFDFTGTKTSGTIFNYQKVTTAITKYALNDTYRTYSPMNAAGVDVELIRSIKAGNWSTIVLPFDIASSDITTIFGAGASVAELSSGTENTLNFSTTLTDSKMKANQPYAIKVASDFTTATINGVTIVSGTPTQTVTNWQFVGTYSNGTIAADNNYYFKSNKLYKAGGSGTTSIKPFRAYLHYTGSEPAPAPTFTIDGDVTGIAHISADGQMSLEEGAFYNLSGQRVAQPTRGLYIVNGRKVVIK